MGKAKSKPAIPAAEEEITTNEEEVTEEASDEAVEDEAIPAAEDAPEATTGKKVTEAFVYNRFHNLMQTYSLKEHGKDFEKLANEIVNQPRRTGWFVVVR